ncbi:uncharacterized protein BDZ99DRAFT_570958 [Mytilinidion resinicola]|uniref:Uncharacterized protein n=1 Tax=Mytilinidion resinicola TaxID=574789 RepID=A0A6A6YPD1_9PEZI|nr:uncharacterized protein BDZ99DRAFT_570958 [Mytilinidion resinicola]KAF2810378.1 hypothetical protein BDZ99DRAFT_570958 [Mytilinidion resinicola]
MGNTQSAPQHNRLVKPKTNSNSPFSSPSIPSPASVSAKYSDLHLDTVIRSPTGDFRSRNDTRQQLRAQLTSPMDGDCSQVSDEDDSLGELATHVRDRLQSLSRSNSVASQMPSSHASTTKLNSLPGSKLSLESETRPVDLEAAISILQELRKNASPEDLAALREALKPVKPAEPVPISTRCPTTRKPVGGEPSQSLIRRRSLATPGLATRGSPTDVLRKPVEHMEAQIDQRMEHEWRVDKMMVHSPLTRLAALDAAREGQDSSTPRCQTPGDLAYSHLGALKLGSLTITNGAASPAPSVRSNMLDRRKSTPDMNQEEDYFTASEGSPSPLASVQHHRGNRMHFRAQSSVLPTPSPLSRETHIPGSSKKAEQPPRSESPLKREAILKNSEYSGHRHETGRSGSHVKNRSAPSIAQEYMNELATSPFATQDEFSERFDEPRESLDSGFAENSSEDAWTYRQEAFRMLDGTMFADSIPRVDSVLEDPHQKRSDRPSHTKADSGYSSGASLRAMERNNRVGEGTIPSLPPLTVVSDGQKQSEYDTEDSRSLYTFDQMLSVSAAAKPLPATPDKKDVRPKPSRLSLSKSWRRASSGATPTISAPPTPNSVVSSESVDGKKSAMSKRLQKRRPSAHAIPLVQSCEPVKEGTIPTIPDNVRAHFTCRLSEAPGMDHLTQTFASASTTNPDESGVEAPVIFEPVRFPSPAVDEPRKKKHHHRSQSARPPTPPHRQRRSLSLFRKEKPDVDRNENGAGDDLELLGIADFGTVAQSLGSSPYDVAASTLRKQPVASPTHPHQMGAAFPLAKSTVNMDASTAINVAKMRSRERAAPDAYTQRPRSYHEYNLQAGEATVARRVSSQGRTAVPPMPHMDSDRLSLVRASTSRNGHQNSDSSSARPKLITRETSESALIEKFNEAPATQVSPDWEAPSQLWRQRRKSIGEGLRRPYGDNAHKHSQSYNASPHTGPPTLRPTPPPKSPAAPEPTSSDGSMFDRYGGGLGYGYEHGFGVGGSAGTRHGRSGASRKSMHFSNEFGIDLSDVPVILQEAR